ncbi:MAG: hypothetical protein WC515_03445 [Candidatus Omnitrophota bacterium]
MKANITVPIIAVAVLTGALTYATSPFSKTNPVKSPVSSPRHSASFEDFTFTKYADNGTEKRYTIEGKRIRAVNRKIALFSTDVSKAVRLEDVLITFYENNAPVSYLSAKRAILGAPIQKGDMISAMTSRIELSRDICLVTTQHRTLSCRTLVLDNAKNTVFANGNCVLRYDGKAVKADMVDSDVALRNFDIRNDRYKRVRSLTRIFG